MRYRRFTQEELQLLEPDFIRFLAFNGIPAEEWERLKSTDPLRVDALIEQFSDTIFERTLQNIEYLEFHSPKDIKTFHCQKEKIVLIGLQLDGTSENHPLMDKKGSELLQAIQEGTIRAKLYTQEKAYQQNDREMELFRMLEHGALISKDGYWFQLLSAALSHP